MTTRGYWIAILAVALAFIAAINTSSAARQRTKPRDGAAPAAVASRPHVPQAEAEAQTCTAARRVFREIAETGRVPDGVPITAAMPSTTESAAEGVVSIAQMPVSTALQAPPSCSCTAASDARDATWKCSAWMVRDVHHSLQLSFDTDGDGARLTRIESMIGGW